MHDDDLSDDELRAALECRATRSTPAGVDALLARTRAEVPADQRRRSGRGAWMAAAAALTLLVGLTAYVASVDGPDPDEVTVGVDGGSEAGVDAEAPDGRGTASSTDLCEPRREQSSTADCVLVDTIPQNPLTETVADLVQDPAALDPVSIDEVLAEYAEAFAQADLLVIDGACGSVALELFADLFGGRPGGPRTYWASGHLAEPLTSELQGSFVAVSTHDPALWPAALALAESMGIGADNVVPGEMDPSQWGIEFDGRADVVVVVGSDRDPGWTQCVDPSECLLDVDPPAAVGDVLHPPATVAVLVLNGTTAVGAAGQLTEELQLVRGYCALTPGNAISGGVESTVVYHVDGYELDARQIAQILNAPPRSVQPLPEGVVPPETDGEPHVVVVLGEDLVG